jgi:hypothetical protein
MLTHLLLPSLLQTDSNPVWRGARVQVGMTGDDRYRRRNGHAVVVVLQHRVHVVRLNPP